MAADDSKSLNRRYPGRECDNITKKPRLDDALVEDSDSDEDLEIGVGGSELVMGDYVFKSILFRSAWVEPSTTNRRLTIAIVLPSGTGAGDWSAHVADGEYFYDVEVYWPEEFSDVKLLHGKWLHRKGADRLEPYHPKMIGFESALKALRPRHSESIKSRARIPQPFAFGERKQAVVEFRFAGAIRGFSTLI